MKHTIVNKVFPALVSLSVLGAPMMVSAAALTFKDLVGKLLGFFDQIGVVLVGLAVFLLAFGIMRYIDAGGDPTRLAEGRKLTLWGLLAVFVMVSMWGLVNLVLASLFPTTNTPFILNNQLFTP